MQSVATRYAARLTAPAEARLKRWVLAVIASQDGGRGADFDHPLGDPGLFGPDSVTWTLHADFPGMMAGGVCALMLQTLHPLALAGVWDHSNFRGDILGRLRRTTAFVAVTTYAGRAEAERLIERVRTIHRAVRGTAPDGRPYAADDPALLTWVHCTEMWSFSAGFQRYHGPRLPTAQLDRYFDETRRIAEALGARDVPRSAAEIDAYFRSVQPDLVFSERSAAVLEVLANIHLPIPTGGLARQTFLGAGAALLPDWARARLRPGRLQRLRDDYGARSLKLAAPLLRAALREGVAARSHRRVNGELGSDTN